MVSKTATIEREPKVAPTTATTKQRTTRAKTAPDPAPVQEAEPTTKATGTKKASTTRKKAATTTAPEEGPQRLGTFQVEQAALRMGVSVLGCFSGKVANQAWKEATILHAAGDTLTLRRMTDHLAIETSVELVDVQVESPHELEMAIQSKTLSGFVQRTEGTLSFLVHSDRTILKSSPVTGELSDQATTRGGTYSLSNQRMDGHQFPEFVLNHDKAMCLPADELLEGLLMVIPSALRKETTDKPVLAAVAVAISRDEHGPLLSMTTTDGHRLARMIVGLNDRNADETSPMAIPLETINELIKALKLGNPSEVWMQIFEEEGAVEFAWGKTKVRSSLYKDLPNYEQVIEGQAAKPRTTVQVDRTLLKPVLKRMSLVTEKMQIQTVTLTFHEEDGEPVLTVSASQEGTEGQEIIPADFPPGFSKQLSVSLRLLEGLLNPLSCRVAAFQVAGATDAIFIQPTQDEDLKEPPDYLGLLMPVQINRQ